MIDAHSPDYPDRYEQIPQDAGERLYRVSRDLYAPVLAAFAVRCLVGVRAERGMLNVCLARDGISSFLAQRVLLRVAPTHFQGVSPCQVQLAYVSRQLMRESRRCARTRDLVDGYLSGQGVRRARAVTLIDVGLHGSIQDQLQQWYPQSNIRGHYLIYRRRFADPNATRKCGFLVGDPMAADEVCFLRREVVHLIEDLWSGVYESVTSLQPVIAPRKAACVRPALERLGTSSRLRLPAPELRRLKRTALQGVVDGVAQSVRTGGKVLLEHGEQDEREESGAARAWRTDHTRRLSEWIASTREGGAPDSWLWRTLIRPDRSASGTWDESSD